MQYNMVEFQLISEIMSLTINCKNFLSDSLKITNSKHLLKKLKVKLPLIIQNVTNISNCSLFQTSFEHVKTASENNIENKEMESWVGNKDVFPFSISLIFLSNDILFDLKKYQFEDGDQVKFIDSILTHLIYLYKTCILLEKVLN